MSSPVLRRPIVAANWKMHGDRASCAALATEIHDRVTDSLAVEIVICPPFPYLLPVSATLGERIVLGAQDTHPSPQGAHTGDVSAQMLADLGCRYGIVGHSERRAQHGESDALVRDKAAALIAAGVHPIVCVGETLEQRESGATKEVLARQLSGSLAGLADSSDWVLAYEPVWAIGTGLSATPEQAQEVHAFLRAQLASMENVTTAAAVRIQYGGSVNAKNAAALFACPDIDGGLVGGASLDATEFAAIVRACAGC